MQEYRNIKIFYKNIAFFNWSEEIFVIKKVKNIIRDLKGEGIVETVY